MAYSVKSSDIVEEVLSLYRQERWERQKKAEASSVLNLISGITYDAILIAVGREIGAGLLNVIPQLREIASDFSISPTEYFAAEERMKQRAANLSADSNQWVCVSGRVLDWVFSQKPTYPIDPAVLESWKKEGHPVFKNTYAYSPALPVSDVTVAELRARKGRHRYIYCITEEGELHIANIWKDAKEIKHSQISLNKDVFCAGEVTFVDGQILDIDPLSGRYKPGTKPGEPALNALVEEAFTPNFPEAAGKFVDRSQESAGDRMQREKKDSPEFGSAVSFAFAAAAFAMGSGTEFGDAEFEERLDEEVTQAGTLKDSAQDLCERVDDKITLGLYRVGKSHHADYMNLIQKEKSAFDLAKHHAEAMGWDSASSRGVLEVGEDLYQALKKIQHEANEAAQTLEEYVQESDQRAREIALAKSQAQAYQAYAEGLKKGAPLPDHAPPVSPPKKSMPAAAAQEAAYVEPLPRPKDKSKQKVDLRQRIAARQAEKMQKPGQVTAKAITLAPKPVSVSAPKAANLYRDPPPASAPSGTGHPSVDPVNAHRVVRLVPPVSQSVPAFGESVHAEVMEPPSWERPWDGNPTQLYSEEMGRWSAEIEQSRVRAVRIAELLGNADPRHLGPAVTEKLKAELHTIVKDLNAFRASQDPLSRPIDLKISEGRSWGDIAKNLKETGKSLARGFIPAAGGMALSYVAGRIAQEFDASPSATAAYKAGATVIGTAGLGRVMNLPPKTLAKYTMAMAAEPVSDYFHKQIGHFDSKEHNLVMQAVSGAVGALGITIIPVEAVMGAAVGAYQAVTSTGGPGFVESMQNGMADATYDAMKRFDKHVSEVWDAAIQAGSDAPFEPYSGWAYEKPDMDPSTLHTIAREDLSHLGTADLARDWSASQQRATEALTFAEALSLSTLASQTPAAPYQPCMSELMSMNSRLFPSSMVSMLGTEGWTCQAPVNTATTPFGALGEHSALGALGYAPQTATAPTSSPAAHYFSGLK